MAERRVAARLSTSKLKEERNNPALRNARVDPWWRDRATQTDLGQGATQETCKKVPQALGDTEIKEANPSGFDPAGVDSLLDVNERGKSVLMAAEAQGVHETEGHGVGTPAEAALGRVQLWKDVGRNVSIDQGARKL